jgi:hypothetical protein
VGERKSLTTSRQEKAGAAAHTQQPGAGKLVKVAMGGKLHGGGENPHPMSAVNKQASRRRQEQRHTPSNQEQESL